MWPCLSGGLSVPCGTLLSSAEALFIASFLAGTFAAPKYLPGVDPDLDAGLAVGGVGLREAVVDVCADRLQGDGALVVVLASRDVRAAQAPGNRNFDAACAKLHGAADRLLHRAAEGNAPLELRGDRLGDQLCVLIRALNLHHVDEDLFAVGSGLALVDHLIAELAHTLDLGAALADNDAGAGAVDMDAHLRGIPLDFNSGDSCVIQGFL